MEFIALKLVPVMVTVLMLFIGMALALLAGNISGRIIKKLLGIGGK